MTIKIHVRADTVADPSCSVSGLSDHADIISLSFFYKILQGNTQSLVKKRIPIPYVCLKSWFSPQLDQGVYIYNLMIYIKQYFVRLFLINFKGIVITNINYDN